MKILFSDYGSCLMKGYRNILVILNAEGYNKQALEKALFLAKFDKDVKVTVFLSVFDFSLELTSFFDFAEREKMLQAIVDAKNNDLEQAIKEQNIENPNIATKVVWARNQVKAVEREVKIGKYDLIINDATDPLGHEAGLFTKEFYGNCNKALHDDGIMVYQHGSPFFDEDEDNCRAMHRKAFRSFPINRVYQAHIPTCPAGYWLFGFASKKYHPLKDFDPERWEKRGIETWYYTTHLHRGAFMLPKYVEDILTEEE